MMCVFTQSQVLNENLRQNLLSSTHLELTQIYRYRVRPIAIVRGRYQVQLLRKAKIFLIRSCQSKRRSRRSCQLREMLFVFNGSAGTGCIRSSVILPPNQKLTSVCGTRSIAFFANCKVVPKQIVHCANTSRNF